MVSLIYIYLHWFTLNLAKRGKPGFHFTLWDPELCVHNGNCHCLAQLINSIIKVEESESEDVGCLIHCVIKAEFRSQFELG